MTCFPIIKPYHDALENTEQWCIAAVAGKDWAVKVFPDLSPDKAVEKLWEAILDTSRVDGDPVAAWKKHNENLAKRCKFLNDCKFARLEYKSANGTNFTVGLNAVGKLCGGGETTIGKNRVYFNPNIPTEEIFISPKAGEAEGIVYATKPLSYQGELIEDFSLRFENGKVVEVKAKKNVDLLEKMISMDEGAKMLGECALIPYDSPINNLGILFYNTLFDENASCHLALGHGFTNCVKGYENMTKEELTKRGVNDSLIHVDFMIGSRDLEITGITSRGARVPILTYGNWAF